MFNKTRKFTEKSFLITNVGFTQSHSAPLNDPPRRYIQLMAGTYKSYKPLNITRNDKIHLKCVCSDGSFVTGVREPILFSFELDRPSEHKI